MRVTSDTFEFRDWPSRKPSKKKLAREAFKSDPLGTSGSIAQQAGKRAIERAGEQTITRVLRSARAALPAVGLAAGPAAAAAAILAAGYLVGDRIARDQRVKLGDRLNTISTRFAETQRQLEAAFGTTRWDGVPADLRAKAVRDYKSAIATATSRAQGQAFAGARAEGSYK